MGESTFKLFITTEIHLKFRKDFECIFLRGKFSELSCKKHSVQDVKDTKEEGVTSVTARKPESGEPDSLLCNFSGEIQSHRKCYDFLNIVKFFYYLADNNGRKWKKYKDISKNFKENLVRSMCKFR